MTRNWPTGSARRDLGALESGTNSAVSATAARPTGMLAQKIPRQPTAPTSTPPSNGPNAIDRPNTPSQTPMARARSAGPVKVLVMMPSAAGLSIEPPTPCRTRKAIRAPRPGARLHSHEPRVNSDRPTWKIVLRPIRSATAPENISRAASVMVYAATVHCRPETPPCRSRPIEGSPTFTIVLSRPTMNRLVQHTASMRARRACSAAAVTEPGSMPGSGPCAGSGAVPVAMLVPIFTSEPAPRATSRLRTGTESRPGSRAGTLSDLRWESRAGACITRNPSGTYSPRTSKGLGHVRLGATARAGLRGARPDDRELVDSVDALDPAQLRRPIQGEVRCPRREERQCLFEFRPGQVGAQAVVRSRAEGQQPGLADRGDIEVLPRLTLAVRPLGADRHDRAGRERHAAVLDLLQADPGRKRSDRLEPRDLVDGARGQCRIGAQQLPLSGMTGEQPDRVRELSGRRIDPPGEEVHH